MNPENTLRSTGKVNVTNIGHTLEIATTSGANASIVVTNVLEIDTLKIDNIGHEVLVKGTPNSGDTIKVSNKFYNDNTVTGIDPMEIDTLVQKAANGTLTLDDVTITTALNIVAKTTLVLEDDTTIAAINVDKNLTNVAANLSIKNHADDGDDAITTIKTGVTIDEQGVATDAGTGTVEPSDVTSADSLSAPALLKTTSDNVDFTRSQFTAWKSAYDGMTTAQQAEVSDAVKANLANMEAMLKAMDDAKDLAANVEKSIGTGSYSNISDVVTKINAEIQKASGDNAAEVKAVVASSTDANESAAAKAWTFTLTYQKDDGGSAKTAYGKRTVVETIRITLTA